MHKIFIGFDKRQPVAYNVLQHSIIRRSSKPVAITPLVIDWMPTQKRGLTDFTHTRFLVPHLSNYEGWSLFLDADMLCLHDINELFAMADDRYAVMVCKNDRKFEWPSLMLFNNSKCRNLTPEFVENNNCLKMDWVDSDYIGSLPLEWNHLVGYDQPREHPKLIHFTQGIPDQPETMDDEHASTWLTHRQELYKTADWMDMMGRSVHSIHRNQQHGNVEYKKVESLYEIKDIQFKPIKSNDVLAENVKKNISTGYSLFSPFEGFGKEEKDLVLARNKKALLCASGVSLKSNIDIIKIKQATGEYDIVSVAGAHDFLVQNGVVPNYHFDCDPREDKQRTISLPQKETFYMLASSSDPSYIAALKGYNVRLWHMLFDGIWDLVPEAEGAVAGGSNIGMTALCLLKVMGYSHMETFGLDCSFTDGAQYAYSGSSKEHNRIKVKCGDKWYESSLNMVGACKEFFIILNYLKGCHVELFGDGLLQHYVQLNMENMNESVQSSNGAKAA